MNGAVVQASLAGLCWLGGGSDLEAGPYKDNVRRAAEFVVSHVDGMGGPTRPGGGPSWDQSNWGWAHAAIFLGELCQRTPTEEFRAALLRMGKELAQRQEASGGWAHGPGGPNALGYLELNIVSGLALTGLGLARQGGYDVPQTVIDKAEAFLIASSAGDGGIGYSERPGQAGQGNIGRTAAAWLGYVGLGLGKRPWCRKMEGFVRRYAGDILGGHASLMQHVMLAGVAAHALGADARKSYWETARRDLVLARAPDGSFQPRPWAETRSTGSNGDVSFGEVWSTCAWTLPLVTDPSEDATRPGLPAWSGRSVKLR
jgi:hypothetical protein